MTQVLESCTFFDAVCSFQVALYLSDGTPSPTYPVAGQRFMPLQIGDVVDAVLQNLAANANGNILCLHLS